MRDELLKLLENTCPTVDFLNEKSLIDDGILDSYAVLSILAAITEEYDVEFEADDVLPETLNNFDSICDLVQKLLDRKASS
ncbi:MAG: acyl carrier protein [Lachnospiraceae bacterium]|nr:acyl carrier protein [Lachnospiraceae bacterium]MDN4742281.1 acyl carrier protein [Lachnospiraceae bacterium C1.1]